MAILIRNAKINKKIKAYVKMDYTLINNKIVKETVLDGNLDREHVREILDDYLEFGHQCMKNREQFRIPYIGAFKLKTWEDATSEY